MIYTDVFVSTWSRFSQYTKKMIEKELKQTHNKKKLETYTYIQRNLSKPNLNGTNFCVQVK